MEAEEISIRGETVVVSTWQSHITLQALRNALQKGFDCHMAANQLLRDMFGLGAPRAQQQGRVSAKDKVRSACRGGRARRTHSHTHSHTHIHRRRFCDK
jgi:hypothetical protein